MGSTTSDLETFAAGRDRYVDVDQVNRQLGELWQTAAGAADEPAAGLITRACMASLVVHTESETRRDRVTEIVRALTSRYPCRAIVLLAEPAAAGDTLTASITAHCHLAGGGGKQVCCEQVSLHATGGGVKRVRGAVLPLLESDLPVILWWDGNGPPRSGLFDQLRADADRIIFDSTGWDRAAGDAAGVLAELAGLLAGDERSTRRYGDLSWTRLRIWRELTADLFDDPAAREHLDRLTRVTVTHGQGPGARLRAQLYGGWLARQLNWSAAETVARVSLVADNSPAGAGIGLMTIQLRNAEAMFEVRKEHDKRCAVTTVQLPRLCGLPTRRAFAAQEPATLIADELDRSSVSSIYREAVSQAASAWGA